MNLTSATLDRHEPWFWTDNQSAPLIGAQSIAAEIDRPLTIFWCASLGGVSEADALVAFFDKASRHAGHGRRLEFRTLLMKNGTKTPLADVHAPAFRTLLEEAPDFLRLECVALDDEAGSQLALGAWAQLADPPGDQIDTIGVHFAAADLSVIREPLICLIETTSRASREERNVPALLARMENAFVSAAKQRDENA